MLWKLLYALTPGPKREGAAGAYPEDVLEHLAAEALPVERLEVDPGEVARYVAAARYERWPLYHPRDLPEKQLEHWVARQLLELAPGETYLDVASHASPAPDIYEELDGVQAWRLDLRYPRGIHGRVIGADAGAVPLPDGSIHKMALHCSFEHFEGAADQRFVSECARLLAPGGRCCVVPLYLSPRYSIQTDLLRSWPPPREPEALLCCARGWGERHGRFYDAQQLRRRLAAELLQLRVYHVSGAPAWWPGAYAHFAGVFTRRS